VNAQSAISEFLLAAESCLRALAEAYPSSLPSEGYRPLLLIEPVSGDQVRRGRLRERTRFEVHGAGCRFELKSGTVVEIDWDDNGNAVFDSWRLSEYARTSGRGALSRDELRAAAQVHPDLRPADGDFFTRADGRFAVGTRPFD
jgi:hypothetical protein